MKYSASTRGFYSVDMHGDNMPDDVTDESEWQFTHAELLDGQSAGQMIVPDESGFPVLQDQPPLTTEQIETARLCAYADPVTGSDRLFVEASRMQMMGESGWEAVRDTAIARYQEIQNEYPWP